MPKVEGQNGAVPFTPYLTRWHLVPDGAPIHTPSSDLLPVRWRPQAEAVSDLQAQQFAERNLRVLQACDALEEQGRLEKASEESPHSADIMRLDLKLSERWEWTVGIAATFALASLSHFFVEQKALALRHKFDREK